jgi:hypothetical protein
MRTPSTFAPSVRTRRRGEPSPLRGANEVRGRMLSASSSGDAEATVLWLPLVERRAQSPQYFLYVTVAGVRGSPSLKIPLCSLQSRELFIPSPLRDGLYKVWPKTPLVRVSLMSFTCSHLFLAPRLTNGSSALGHLKAVDLVETRRGSRSDSFSLFGVLVAATLGTFKRFFGFLSTACTFRLPSLRTGSLLDS